MKTRVCVFCETWGSGGIEAFINGVASGARLEGLEVDVVAEDVRDSVFTSGLESLGVSFRELPGGIYGLPKNARAFDSLMRERRYQTVHLNLCQAVPLAYAVIAKRRGARVIAHAHNTRLRDSLLKPAKQLAHEAFKRAFSGRADELWACSGEAARFMFPGSELKKKGYAFIPNGVDTGRFRFDEAARVATRERLGAGDGLVIGNIGRLCRQKNQSFLLDVMPEIIKERPEATLLLAGEGPDGEKLKRKASGLGLEGNVIFYGLTSKPEELYAAMDVLAMPSRFEGLPVTMVEAAASGLPVVCSGAMGEVAPLTGGKSRVVPLSAGASAWARAILDEAVGHGVNGRPQAAARVAAAGFDIKGIAAMVRERWLA